nr:MAG TPA: hypothetical protein [Caudoviricetes sp.]
MTVSSVKRNQERLQLPFAKLMKSGLNKPDFFVHIIYKIDRDFVYFAY